MSRRPHSLVPEHPGRRWARPDSADLIGLPPAATLRVIRPPGRELNARYRPGSFNSLPSPTRDQELKNNLATPPQPHVRKKLESRLVRDSRLRLAWIAAGFTERVSGPGHDVGSRPWKVS